jgi:DNA repair protein RadC
MITPNKPQLTKVPVYNVRLVQARALRLAEPVIAHAFTAARTMHAMLGLTDREHFAALFVNGTHQVTGAHVVAIGGQQGIGTIEPRTVFRAAIVACACGIVLGHYVPRHIMRLLLPVPFCCRLSTQPRSGPRRTSGMAT